MFEPKSHNFCACVREREQERERESVFESHLKPLKSVGAMIENASAEHFKRLYVTKV